jgi:hypothetical protein
MIVSVHVTKTAGSSFGEALKRQFGERFMHDDEDWAGYKSPEADARRAANAAQMRDRRDELLETFDVIHGHFVPEKFAGLFPHTDFVAFFRDPFQQAVSHYEFLRRIPQIDHPVVRGFHEANMAIEDFIAWEATKEPQTQLMGGFALEDFAMIGITEEFPRSIALFNAMFGCCLSAQVFQNVNPARKDSGYVIAPDLRKLIEIHRAKDIDLYKRAQALFARQTSYRSIFAVAGSPKAPEFGVLDVPIDQAKAALVAAAVDRYQLKSIVDVGACWGVHGAYTFDALNSGKIERAVIADGDITYLTRDRARGDARVQLLEGSIGDADFVEGIPACDAAIIFDVLLHQVSPDWDEFLALYSRKVNYFIIWNQDWIGSGQSVRYVDRGLRWYLDNVGESDPARVIRWFERHNEMCCQFERPWRDVHYFWQWGIVSSDLVATMHKLGFALDYFNNCGVWSDRCLNIQKDAYLFKKSS